MPGRRLGGRSEAEAGGEEGGPGVVGDGVAVAGDAGAVQYLLGLLAGQLLVEGPQVDQQHVVVGASRDEPEPVTGQRPGQGGRVEHDLLGVLAELRPRRLGEGHRLGRDDVLERTALEPREHGAVDLLGQVLPAEDGAPAWAAQRLVRRERDDVGHTHGVRVGPSGDEPGRVGGVEHEERPHGVGDLAEGVRVDDAGVGRRARHDQGRLLRLGQVGHLVEVDDLTGVRLVRRRRGHPVGDEAPELRDDGRG